MAESLLHIDNLQVQFKTDDGLVRAVDGITMNIQPGETVGIVGESGSGKSVTSLAIMGLVPKPPGIIAGGRAVYQGEDLLTMNQKQLSTIRGNRIAMIFQDPMTALNPFLTVEEQLTEVTILHLGHSRAEARKHAINMLEMVGIPGAERRIDEYPHQFSGGMRQRVMIAIALSCKPDILIADEPTTALDVTIQSQILELMKKLQREEGTAIIMITHDMGVIANVCDRVNVMYAGRVVEQADVRTLFAKPRHPYTMGLLNSIPRLDEAVGEMLTPIEGQPPNLAELPPGCAFAPRCPYCEPGCEQSRPTLKEVDGTSGHRSACFVDIPQKKPEEPSRG